MPELPEVETICRGLAKHLAGQRLARVTVRRRDLRLPIPQDFAERLSGRVVAKVSRRAKYLLMHLDDAAVVIGHLGMSGRMYFETAPWSAKPHDHVIFETDDGRTVVFSDPRRFGLLVLSSEGALAQHALLRDLGPEPLAPDFTPSRLAVGLARRPRSPLKATLLDQTVVAGLGNIYVCEALHRASLSPERLAGTLMATELRRLVRSIRDVLNDALSAGGSTLRDYVQADGEIGSFQNLFRVYARDKNRCPRSGCRGIVQRAVQAGRSTYFCPICQK